jgi:hypothetical protein
MKNGRRIWLLGIFVAAGCELAESGYDYDTVVAGGAADARHPYVVRMVSLFIDGNRNEVSSTVITAQPGVPPKHIIAARHSVQPATDGVGVQISALVGGTAYPVVKAAIHPEADIAVLELEKSIPVEPLVLPEPEAATVRVGDTIIYVAYGAQRMGGPVGEKAAGPAQVVAMSAADIARTVPLPAAPGATPEQALAAWTGAWGPNLFYTTTGAATCGGDSGGLALKEQNNAEVMVGVISHSYSQNNQKKCPDDVSGNVPVAPYLGWIREQMGVMPPPGAPTPPPGPTPGTPSRPAAPEITDSNSSGCTTGSARGLWLSLLGLFAVRKRRATARGPHHTHVRRREHGLGVE